MIPIDEQIAFEKNILPIAAGGMHQAILASLEELKRIREVPVPDEPENWMMVEYLVDGETRKPCHLRVVSKMSYDTLRDLLKRESAKAAEICRHRSVKCSSFGAAYHALSCDGDAEAITRAAEGK
jgi:hypothetical protein